MTALPQEVGEDLFALGKCLPQDKLQTHSTYIKGGGEKTGQPAVSSP